MSVLGYTLYTGLSQGNGGGLDEVEAAGADPGGPLTSRLAFKKASE